jgi:hypothetical protein
MMIWKINNIRYVSSNWLRLRDTSLRTTCFQAEVGTRYLGNRNRPLDWDVGIISYREVINVVWLHVGLGLKDKPGVECWNYQLQE